MFQHLLVTILLLGRLQPIAESLDQEQVRVPPWKRLSERNLQRQDGLKKQREHGLKTWILFLDLVKAFDSDSVPRELPWKVFAILGVPKKLLGLLNCSTRCCRQIRSWRSSTQQTALFM